MTQVRSNEESDGQPRGLSRRHFLKTASGGAAAVLAMSKVSGRGGARVAEVEAATASGNEICRMDAVTLAGHIRAKRLSPVEVVDAVLDRMDKVEPILHAFCTPTPDVARETARRLEADIMAGRAGLALPGRPVWV